MRTGLVAIVVALIAIAGCAAHRQQSGGANAGTSPAGFKAYKPDPAFLTQFGATNRFRLGKPTAIRIVPGGSSVLFLRSGPRDFAQDLYEFDVSTGEERLALSSEQLLGGEEEELSVEELARRERMRMAGRGITSFSMSEDGSRVLVPLSGRLFVVERATGTVREMKSEGAVPLDARFSKDGSQIACVRDGDLYVIDVDSGVERRLTMDAGNGVTNGLAEFVAQEEMDRDHGYWWSPDGSLIAYQQTDTTGLEVFQIADAFDPAKEAQTWPYPRAGTKNADVRLGIIPSAGGSTVLVDWDRELYPYLATVKWPRNGLLTMLVQNRAQTEALLLEVDAATGATRRLLVEQDPAWVRLFQKAPLWLKDGSGFLWLSERSGYLELELRARDGAFVRTIAGREIGLVDLIGVDEEVGVVYVIGGPHPTQKHVWRTSLTASHEPARRLTSESGIHGATLAEDGSLVVVHSNTITDREEWSVRRAESPVIAAGQLRSEAERPSFGINPLFVTVRVDGRELHAVVVRPRGFEYGRRYPVIASVYGGPHVQVVNATRMGYALHQWIADHGYIVVSIDGRGTPARGRDWERTIKGNLIDPALEDCVGGLRALGAQFSEMDISRVGIFGWSFGGYFSAMAAMRHPEMFRAGVAGAPVCDWRDYDTHYTERYMGLLPESEAEYDRSSVLTYCKDLDVPLLIIHGTADDNVYMVNSLKMADALFRAGKEFEFLPLAGATHMVREPEMIERMYGRIMDFFDRALRPQASE